LLKIGLPLVILLISLSRTIIQWDVAILSESINFSLLALFSSISMTMYKVIAGEWKFSYKNIVFLLIIWSVVLVCFSNTRDSNMYLLMVLIPFIMLTLYKNRNKWKILVAMLTVILATILWQNYDAEKNKRWEYPILNAMYEHIIKEANDANYLIDNGMPLPETAIGFTGTIEEFHSSLINDEAREWNSEYGKSVYLKYLISHPISTNIVYLKNTKYRFFDAIIQYYVSPEKFRALSKWINKVSFFDIRYPVAWYIIMLLSAVIACLLPKTRKIGIFTFFLFITQYSQGFIAYFGDGIEPARHSLTANLLFRMNVIMVFIILYFIFKKYFNFHNHFEAGEKFASNQ